MGSAPLCELEPDAARRLAAVVEDNLEREFPHARCSVFDSAGPWLGPRADHPIFFGCYDWHSAVHSHWTLLVLARIFDGEEWAHGLCDRVLSRFTPSAVQGELEYLQRSPGFEMPYGIAWLLALGAEAARARGDDRLQPLVAHAGESLSRWLEVLPAPIRGGQHSQSAFAMLLALIAMRSLGRARATEALEKHARRFYTGDRDCPIAYEPSAYDFLSPALSEALLMSHVLGADFSPWYRTFATSPLSSLSPVTPADRQSGKLVHWDGLNLSRAWMMREIAVALPAADPERGALLERARLHRSAALEVVFSGHYAGTHWLGSFALLALAQEALPLYHGHRG